MNDPVEHIRDFCLGLPEAIERETWDCPTFRVRDKIFAMISDDGGRPGLWCKSTLAIQEALIGTDPERYYSPPYLGHKGWLGIRLDVEVDAELIEDYILESYRFIAPRRIAAKIGQTDE